MDSGAELIAALNQLEKEKGIDKEIIFEAIETSLVTACKKNYASVQEAKVLVDRATGHIDVFAQKPVVEDGALEDRAAQISLTDARSISPKYNVGDLCDVPVAPRDFGRISAQTAKQVVVQKLREAERGMVYRDFKGKERQVVTGIIQRQERKGVIINLGKTEMLLPTGEQVPGEEYDFNSRLKVYVVDVRETPKGPQITVSRTHPELVRRLFEQEVPEAYDGTIEIKAVAREAGSRTKIAVKSNHKDVDPVGACVGAGGGRVNVVVSELGGEKVDVVTWSKFPRKFIANALSPSKALAVALDEELREARVVVPDNQLSLAIGKEGQNARLAARLTGYRIDIKSKSQADKIDFVTDKDYAEFVATMLFKETDMDERHIDAPELPIDEPEAPKPDAAEPASPPEQAAEAPAEPQYAEGEYYDEEYDEYYDEYDEYYDEYDDEYYDDEYYDEAAAKPAEPAEPAGADGVK